MKYTELFTLKKLTACVAVVAMVSFTAMPVAHAASKEKKEKLEKPNLKFGFIKLTDMAPLAIAYEKGFFKDEGLNVELEAQANWKVVMDRVVSGELDGSHMLAPAPLGASIGFGTKAVITGDVTQIDLQRHQKSGLVEAQKILKDIKGIAMTHFLSQDVVRHPLVQKIVNAYEEYEKKQAD